MWPTLAFATPLSGNDLVRLTLPGDQVIEGRFSWSSENCIELASGLEKIVLHQKLITKVEINREQIALPDFKRDLQFNWEIKRPLLQSYGHLPEPRFAALSAVVTAGAPFGVIADWNQFWLTTIFEGLLLTGGIYGFAVEDNVGMTVSFISLDVLLRLWSSRKVFSLIRDRQNTKHRIDLAEQKNCVIMK